MEPVEIQSRLAFIQEAEKLKSVLRSSITSDGRKESTAEHTWRLCLLAMVFEDHFQHLDFAKVLKICILHDLGEAINGDIPAVDQEPGIDKSAQEREARPESRPGVQVRCRYIRASGRRLRYGSIETVECR